MYPQFTKNFIEQVIKDLGTENSAYSIILVDVSNNYKNYYVVYIDILLEEPSSTDPESTIIKSLHTQLTDNNIPLIIDKEDIEILLNTLKEHEAKVMNEEDIRELLV